MKLSHIAFSIGLIFTSGLAHAEPLELNLSGGNPGGLWSLLGAGMDRAVKKSDASSVITYQATGGGLANIGLLSKQKADIAIVHNAEIKIATAGEKPFKTPVTNMRGIGYIYNWAPMHFFLSKSIADKHGIVSLDDLAKAKVALRIGVNRAGNITNNVALFMLEQVGLTEKSVKANGGLIVRAGANDQAGLLQDGRIDVVTNGVFVLHSSFRAIDEKTDVILLSIPEKVIAATNEKFGTQTFTIPGGSYSKQPKEIKTSALGALLVTRKGMKEGVIYDLTKALINNIDEVRAVHKSMTKLNLELLASQRVLPFHPGAERAFREAGLIK